MNHFKCFVKLSNSIKINNSTLIEVLMSNIRLGNKFFRERKYEIALQFYDLLVEINPNLGYLIKGLSNK